MGAGGHILGDPDIAADHCTLADGHPPQDGGAGVDHHVVLDDGVACPAFLQVALGILGKALGAQGHGLVDAHVLSEDGGLSDHHARAVVDEAARTDLRTGVDVDARLPMGQLGHDARQQRQVQPVEGVGDAVVDEGQHAGVAQHHLVHAARGRVAVEGSQHVGVQQLAQAGQLLRKGLHRLQRQGGVVLGRGTRAAVAVVQLDLGLGLQNLQCRVQRVAHVEVFAGVAQVGWAQAQRVEHAFEPLQGLGNRGARGKFTVAGVGAVLLLAPMVADLAQLLDDGADVEGAHGDSPVKWQG
ncbi:Uncharacterised protein [Comamonas aquatica]|uniref:Uncharacterized protein n=1 Tax=Comamonas aquatica TaxID=225991 RepID=A0AA35DAD7_9BURK|nr:Uncharacterised protein [Comamonas aquatica]